LEFCAVAQVPRMLGAMDDRKLAFDALSLNEGSHHPQKW